MSQAELLPKVAPVSPFQFQNHLIRVCEADNILWFVARDVCSALDIAWRGNTLDNIPTAWKGMRSFRIEQRNQPLKCITEPAVYKLAFRSNKPEADAFTNWIASEVLPSIRKTGKFEATPKGSALPASLQSELHALVDAKLSAFPRAVQGRARSEIWTRFNRHFKIARYAQLPPARMPEARDYLIEMEVRALAGLPASAPLPTPKQDNVPAWDEMPMPADLDKRRARICRELYELQEKFGMLVNDIRICLHPGGRLLRLPPELDNAYETLDALNRVATGGAYTARQAIYSAYQIGKGLKFV